ncbi:acyltransferase domain-containing protein [Streptomyces sp. H27-D2]|uniref:acyltransferase domain-containing protein n=1 Tax=Streptomyces sp. H27-D2 TaxID=3046304 RepID=UPI002DBC8E75|nr:acyltransferase domain-containing protein [Streptomyces sp. H27-D2]MEC4017087.1 acyltransferase domain-containing protein [Streptomyces sp. H27-D2]
MTTRTAFLFPGQGAYIPGVLSKRIDQFPSARTLLDTVDETAAEYGHEAISPLLLEPDAASVDELLEQRPEALDLAIYAIDAAAYEILVGLGVRADVLVGHSFGELAALTSAKAVSVSDATRIVCERSAAFRQAELPESGMVALGLGARRAQHLVGLLDDSQLCLAVDNGPAQSVVSGPAESLQEVARLASAVGVRATRLRAGHAFHNPLLYGVTDVFSQATAQLPLHAPRVPVFSATLSRYLRTSADVRELVERHMVQPVHFYAGLLTLFQDGVRVFVEAGARQALAGLVRESLPSSARVTSLLPSRGSAEKLVEALRSADIHVNGLPAPEEPQSAPIPVPPIATAADHVRPRENALPDHPQLMAELAEIYAEQLGFPAELLTADIDLEAELGVDSLKQLAVFEHALRHYELSEPAPDRRVVATTLAQVSEVLQELSP